MPTICYENPSLTGAWAYKPRLVKKILGWYAPWYLDVSTGCWVSVFFQCRALSHFRSRINQQVCQDLRPYKLFIVTAGYQIVRNQRLFLESIPEIRRDSDCDDTSDAETRR